MNVGRDRFPMLLRKCVCITCVLMGQMSSVGTRTPDEEKNMSSIVAQD